MTGTQVNPRRRKRNSRTSLKKSRPGRVVGVVGMGLMGTSISACLLIAGHSLVCIDSNPAKLRTARGRLLKLLTEAHGKGLLTASPSTLIQRVAASTEFLGLKDAELVIESTVEDLAVKRQVIAEIEKVVSKSALIGSNTSAIPVTGLQSDAMHPERILGLHWSEPAHITRFMEIVCGENTSPTNARLAMRLARAWGKEPLLIRKDIRGFVANRMMYALLREAFHLVDAGYASIADIDRSMRNDLGYWITFAGPFRFMDLTGIPAYAEVMKDLLPDLSCATEVPRLMRRVVDSGARGVSNAKGFYHYTPAQARRWEKLFMQFNYRIRELADTYPEGRGDTRRSKLTAAG